MLTPRGSTAKGLADKAKVVTDVKKEEIEGGVDAKKESGAAGVSRLQSSASASELGDAAEGKEAKMAGAKEKPVSPGQEKEGCGVDTKTLRGVVVAAVVLLGILVAKGSKKAKKVEEPAPVQKEKKGLWW